MLDSRVLLLLLAGHEVGVVAVLQPAARVHADRLQTAARGRGDAHVGPGWWNRQRPDALQLRLLDDRPALRVNVAKATQLRAGASPPTGARAALDGPAQLLRRRALNFYLCVSHRQ